MQNMILEALQLTLNNALDGSTALEAEIQNYPELLKVIQYILYLHYLNANSCWIEQKEIYEFETSSSLLSPPLTSPLTFTLPSLLFPFLFFPRLRASLDGHPLSSMQLLRPESCLSSKVRCT
jgi:hypothetical protein